MEITLGDDGLNGSSKRDRARDRDRHRRGDRPSRFQDRSPSSERDRPGHRAPADRRVYISNIPYEFRWQDLKDLFRSEVGEVDYVELFADEGDKPRGCGIIEFTSQASVKKAIEKMHRHEVRGRKLVVKEDFDIERDPAGRLMAGGGGGGGGGSMGRGRSNSGSRRDDPPPRHSRWQANESRQRSASPSAKGWGFTYGLSPAFLESLGIKGPLVNRVFIANLDYKVDEKKLQEVFKLAGKVVNAELNKDKDGKSRGHGVIEYEHPVEAVQAISMLHHQMLFDRLLTVRMDRVNEKVEGQPPKLPEGLRGIGMGLGEGGKPLQDVSRSLPASVQNAQLQSMAALQTSGIANLTNQAALSGMTGLANMQQNSVGGMGFAGSSGGVGGLQGVMGGGMSGLGGSLAGLHGLSSSMGGGGDMGMGGGGLGGVAGLGNSGLGLSVGGGFGGSGNSLGMGGGLGSSSFGSSGMSQMQSGPYLGSGGTSSGFGLGGVTSSSYGGGRSFVDLPPSFNSLDDRDFRTSSSFNNGGQIKLPSSSSSMDRKPIDSDTIVVRNLAPSVTWQVLRDKFREFGDVKFAEIRNKDTGLVRFSSTRDAQRAADLMDRSRIDGRVVDVLLY